MTKQVNKLFLLSVVIILLACNGSKNEIKNTNNLNNNNFKKHPKAINESSINALINKYNAITDWDSLETFTYVLQKRLSSENKPISIVGEIKDIAYNDSLYILKVYNLNVNDNCNYFAYISVSEEKFNRLRRPLQSNKLTNRGCFIIKVSKITSDYPRIIPGIELGGIETYSYLDFDFDSKLLIFTGELIDFYILENKNY